MASSHHISKSARRACLAVAEGGVWFLAAVMVSLVLLSSIKDDSSGSAVYQTGVQANRLVENKPCDEIYVVAEGETLHSISDKCGDPYIVEQNPHIHDPDDVFPGLVIKITPRPPQ